MSTEEKPSSSPPSPVRLGLPSPPDSNGVGVGVPVEPIKTVGSLDKEQEVLQDPLGVVSLKGVNTGASQEGLTGPPPVEVEDPDTAAAEAVERGVEVLGQHYNQPKLHPKVY